ncbi:beta-ketoacyl synthase N-terminal-like domain-containing protein, partial [Streptomyces niveus]|uniref:beta-ketoacyl synthase N-terminal-like domain-containing protein n=1 Tax=Streptomyces niveus TaxID=193462 RepID=UPI0020D281E8
MARDTAEGGVVEAVEVDAAPALAGERPDTDALISELRRELAELRSRTPDPGEPVAVVGSACRLPGGADTPDALWESLRAGRDLVRPLTGER